MPWSWTNQLWSLAPLLLLAPAFLLRRNRERGVAAVWLAVLVLYFLWLPLSWASGEGTANVEQMLGMIAVGLGLLWLLLPWLATGGRLRTWFLSLLVTLVAEWVAFLCFNGFALERTSFTGPAPALPTLATAILITCAFLSVRPAHGDSPPSLSLPRLVASVALLTPATVLGVLLVVEGAALLSRPRDLAEILVATVFLGLACLVTAAPFLLLSAVSATYRERFREAFGGS